MTRAWPVFALLAAAGALAGHACANRLKLWEIVHDECVPAAQNGGALPRPCLRVDADGGYAVIKDINGVAQVLAIPSKPVEGIEDAQLLADDALPYFADAWRARDLMAAYLHPPPPRERVAIAVNSKLARSQDQLHFHVDCLRADVAQALAGYAPHFDDNWRPMTEALQGRKYWARRVLSADLAGVDPFHLLARDMPVAAGEMGKWSLAAIPVLFAGVPGFVLLADPAELTAGGHAEDLQDHDCAVVR